MKRNFIIVIMLLLLVLTLAGCGNTDNSNTDNDGTSDGTNGEVQEDLHSINMPSVDSILSFKVGVFGSGTVVEYGNSETITSIINGINSSAKYVKESVNDSPTNIDEYIDFCIKYKNEYKQPTTMYVYLNKDKAYLEQPYQGVWNIEKTVYDEIVNILS